MLRYYAKDIESYTGIDIKPENATYRNRRVTDNKPVEKNYYPFRVYFVNGNVAEMSSKLSKQYFSFIVYTSSIEHMHPDLGLKSLYEARTVAKDGARLFLTCPNTPEDQNGYDTQYAAHIYEWKRSEIESGLKGSGWKLEDVYGIYMKADALKRCLDKRPNLKKMYERQRTYISSEWLIPGYAALFPEDASELAYVATTM
jgi:SAM-dependent methyltransferase